MDGHLLKLQTVLPVSVVSVIIVASQSNEFCMSKRVTEKHLSTSICPNLEEETQKMPNWLLFESQVGLISYLRIEQFSPVRKEIKFEAGCSSRQCYTTNE